MSQENDLLELKSLFWDVDLKTLSWEQHRDFVIRRILVSGTLSHFRWLRAKIGDDALAAWIIEHNGRGLSPRQLRYWEVILDLPRVMVDHWVEASKATVWGQRMG